MKIQQIANFKSQSDFFNLEIGSWKLKISQRGFTLAELGISMGVLAILLSVASVNLLRSQNKAALTATTDVLLSDLKQQQMKAMTGDTEGRATGSAYGIHFDEDKYVLFNGATYTGVGSEIPLEGSVVFSSVLFPNDEVVFQKASGEINGYNSASDTLTITNTASQEQVTLEMNRYGVVISLE